MKKILFILLLCLICFPGSSALCEDNITFTNVAVDIYGYSEQFVQGDRIRVYDETDILCGQFDIQKDGQFGLMSVYGDDILSKDIDEGAKPGDVLSFYLNGVKISPTNMDTVVWTQNGDRIRVDF